MTSLARDPDPSAERLQAAVGPGFSVGECIGQGGFGVVYAARDVRLGRAVAIKALRRELFESDAMQQRFELEARVVASLRHPHIVPIFDVGEGDGIAYMVMPRIDGVTLRSELDRLGRLPVLDVLRIGGEIADALHAAHQQGILHRDVKPENIMLEGRERRALLMDFGIARSTERAEGEATESGVAFGSPRYMSPEQARAMPGLDARSDLYSLGVVCYELLAGRRPYDSQNLSDLIYRQVTAPPTPLAQLRPECEGELSDAIMACLQLEPAKRPRSADELSKTLRGLARVSSASVLDRLSDRSWLDRRLLPASLLAFAVYAIAFMLPIFDLLMAASASSDTARVAATLVPIMRLVGWAVLVGVPALLVDLVFTLTALHRAGAPRSARPRLMFGQPRWWGTWFPRALRSRESVWSGLTLTAKVANLAAWVVIGASIGLLPWLILGRPSTGSFADLGLALPLPTRLMIAVAAVLADAVRVGLVVVLGSLLLWRLRHGVALVDGIRALVSARRGLVQDSTAKALLRTE